MSKDVIDYHQLGKRKAKIILKNLYGEPSKENRKILSQKNIASNFAKDSDTQNLLEKDNKNSSSLSDYAKGFKNGLVEYCGESSYANNGRNSTKFAEEVMIIINQDYSNYCTSKNDMMGAIVESNEYSNT